MSRLIDWIFGKQDFEYVQFTFWGAVLLIGFAWLITGVLITCFYEFPGMIAWYMGLKFSDQMALIFGVPSVVIILAAVCALTINDSNIYETFQREGTRDEP